MSGAARHVRRRLASLGTLSPGDPVPSPCNSVCRIDEQSGLCDGCLRTLDEVAQWGLLDDDGKRAVWHRLQARAVALTPTLSRKRERE